MAPLSIIYPKLPSSLAKIVTSFHKRSLSCDYYDSSCNDSHRLVVLIIILLVGFFFSLIFTLVYFRGRRARMLGERRARMDREQMNLGGRTKPSEGQEWQAPPPPYMPMRPESAARMGR